MNAADAILDLSGLRVSTQDIVLRILCAMVIGIVIGTEREYTHKPAGMRTHMLVSIGAATVMITSQLLFCQYRPYGATPDPARLSAQVISGVGFLGAGTILREGSTIKGLTTAASIWAIAALGVAAGAGYFTVALLGTFFMFVTLVLFEFLQHQFAKNCRVRYTIEVTCVRIGAALEQIKACADNVDVSVQSIHVDDNPEHGAVISFYSDFGGRRGELRLQSFVNELRGHDSIQSVCTHAFMERTA